jgi:hypothetical protein
MTIGSLIIQGDKVAALDTALAAAVDLYVPTFVEHITAIDTTQDSDLHASKLRTLDDPEGAILAMLALRAFEKVVTADTAAGAVVLEQIQGAFLMHWEFRQLARDTKGAIIVAG